MWVSFRFLGSESSTIPVGIVGPSKDTMEENTSHPRECTDMVVMQVHSPLPIKSRAKV